MQIVVNSLLANYTEVGSGTHIMLFLHGWADSSKSFEALAKDVVKKSPAYRAVLLDMPGFGEGQAPDKPWNLDDYASFVHDFLEKKKYHASVIVGHSNGGAIAIRGVAKGKLKPHKLILIGSAGVRKRKIRHRVLKAASVPGKAALALTPRPARRKIRQKFYKAIGSDYLIAEHMQETFKNIISTDVTADAAHIKLPTCLIYGEDDKATPVAYGETFKAAIAGSQLHVIPYAGHFVHHEQAYKVATIMTDFLSIS